jgi:Skp family chaperone for outer membrane proteins
MRILAILSVVLASLAFAAPADAANTTAVVDIVRCMEAHKETKNVEEAFRVARQQAEENAALTEKRLQDLKRQLEALNAQDPNRAVKQRQLELQLATAKFNYEWDMKQAVEDYVRGLESIYGAVRGQIQAYARENGIDLVLIRTDPNQRINATDPKEFALKTRLRVVLYAEGRYDITDAIVKIVQSK